MLKRDRCPVAPADCHYEWVAACLAPYLVMLACLLVLFMPILNSMGVTLETGIAVAGMQPTFETALLTLIFVASFSLGIFRKHENEWFCFFDSISIPGILFWVVHTMKETGIL